MWAWMRYRGIYEKEMKKLTPKPRGKKIILKRGDSPVEHYLKLLLELLKEKPIAHYEGEWWNIFKFDGNKENAIQEIETILKQLNS